MGIEVILGKLSMDSKKSTQRVETSDTLILRQVVLLDNVNAPPYLYNKKISYK